MRRAAAALGVAVDLQLAQRARKRIGVDAVERWEATSVHGWESRVVRDLQRTRAPPGCCTVPAFFVSSPCANSSSVMTASCIPFSLTCKQPSGSVLYDTV